MQVKINGKDREVPAGVSVSKVLELLLLDAERVVVEHNREILGKSRYGAVRLQDGDALEIVHFVGGG